MPFWNTIKERLNGRSVRLWRASLAAFLVLSFGILCPALTGCVTRSEIRAALWLNNGLPADLCEREQILWDYGFYRRLDSGQLEFIPFCAQEVRRYFAIHEVDLNAILDETLPEKSP